MNERDRIAEYLGVLSTYDNSRNRVLNAIKVVEDVDHINISLESKEGTTSFNSRSIGFGTAYMEHIVTECFDKNKALNILRNELISIENQIDKFLAKTKNELMGVTDDEQR